MRGLVIWATSVASVALALAACVTERIPVGPGPGSVRVSIVQIDPFTEPAGCAGVPALGSELCRRPFPEQGAPVSLRIRAELRDRHGEPLPAPKDLAGIIDVRPGQLSGVGPAGEMLFFVAGSSVAEVDIQVIHAYGPTRIWVEECGTDKDAGSFATGVSDPIWFELPRLDQLNATADNTTSPMTPQPTNVCVLTGDPRFGWETDVETESRVWVGYSHGGTVNAPPPAMGTFVDVVGCSREEYDRLASEGGCERGPLVVTAIGNEGFYVSDLNPYLPIADEARIALGFNHVYAFTFSYPDDLEVGDLLTSVRGSPVEFAGSTQFSNPTWQRDGVRRGSDLLALLREQKRLPVTIAADTYAAALRSYGRNREEQLALERLEGAPVCFDNLAPASVLVSCDKNESGNIERQGCMKDASAPLPPRCEVGMGSAYRPPLCEKGDRYDFCLALTEDELTKCELATYVPSNPPEYCCERLCYNDPTCSEASSYIIYGQWTADVYGRYDEGETPPVKIALITRDADPDFDPLKFALEQRALPPESRQTLRVVGNLRQVLAARPVWVVVARSPGDIKIGETCPR